MAQTTFRKVSSQVVPMVRKISTKVFLPVVEPSLDPAVYDLNGYAFAFNLVVLYGFVAVGYIVPTLLGVATRGFFCDDDTIRYEYRDDTISAVQLVVYNLVMNMVTVLAVEYYRIQKVELNIRNPRYRWRNSHLHVLFVKVITYIGYAQIGFVMNMVLNVITKHLVGRLRPHFLDVCKLEVDMCSDPAKAHTYILDYVCTGAPEKVLEARKSFYSGHSSISLYCAVWSALYIQARLSPALYNRVVVPIIQTLIIGVGLGISFSRITDNKHHWSDVLVGICVGTFIAVYTCVFWTELFKNRKAAEEETQPLVVSTPSYSRVQSPTVPTQSSPLEPLVTPTVVETTA